eukprot:7762241-Pyramimonas_sp.AAC.1
MKKKGSLVNRAPPEGVRAFLHAVARDINSFESGEGDVAEQTLEDWKARMRTASLRFEHTTNEADIWWRARALRGAVQEDCTSMRRSALQRIFEICEV